MNSEDLLALQRCDTLFVASVAPGGMPDASHRGGPPGFVERLADGRLRIPDFPGNSMFNTWGNLALEPRVGMVVPDFAQGRTLQVGGRVELEWGQEEEGGKSLGTGRFWRVGVERVRVATTPITMSWESLGDGDEGTPG